LTDEPMLRFMARPCRLLGYKSCHLVVVSIWSCNTTGTCVGHLVSGCWLLVADCWVEL